MPFPIRRTTPNHPSWKESLLETPPILLATLSLSKEISQLSVHVLTIFIIRKFFLWFHWQSYCSVRLSFLDRYRCQDILHACVHECKVTQSCPTPFSPMDCKLPAPPPPPRLSMGFSRQESWSGLPCPPPGDLPNPGIKPVPLMSPALADGFFTTSTTCHPSLNKSPIPECGKAFSFSTRKSQPEGTPNSSALVRSTFLHSASGSSFLQFDWSCRDVSEGRTGSFCGEVPAGHWHHELWPSWYPHCPWSLRLTWSFILTSFLASRLPITDLLPAVSL